jgi:hypothetical protein
LAKIACNAALTRFLVRLSGSGQVGLHAFGGSAIAKCVVQQAEYASEIPEGRVMLSDGTKAFVKFMAALIFVALAVQWHGEWSADRSEAARRADLTVEQRAVEDAAAARLAERQRQEQANKNRERPFITACRAALTNALHDPMSASVEYSSGWFGDAGVYTGVFEGRAKNLFGAYVLGEWHCKALAADGGAVTVLGVVQVKP